MPQDARQSATTANPLDAAKASAQALVRKRRDGRDYFEEQYDKTLAAMLRANVAVTWRRIGALVLGLALIISAAAAYYVGYRNLVMAEALAAAVGVVLIGWAWLYLRRGKEGSLGEVEQGLDELREADLTSLLARADERLAFVGDTDLKQKLVLRGFPDRQRLPGAFFAGRVGSDGRVRFTPVGVTVFALGPDTVAAYKGAIDLTSGDVLYERLVEFPYRDISALELVMSTRGDEGETEPKKKGPVTVMKEAAAQKMRARQPQKDKEALAVHLSSSVSVETVLSDRGFVDAWKGGKLGIITPIESDEHCRQVWQTLRERWRKALDRG